MGRSASEGGDWAPALICRGYENKVVYRNAGLAKELLFF